MLCYLRATGCLALIAAVATPIASAAVVFSDVTIELLSERRVGTTSGGAGIADDFDSQTGPRNSAAPAVQTIASALGTVPFPGIPTTQSTAFAAQAVDFSGAFGSSVSFYIPPETPAPDFVDSYLWLNTLTYSLTLTNDSSAAESGRFGLFFPALSMRLLGASKLPSDDPFQFFIGNVTVQFSVNDLEEAISAFSFFNDTDDGLIAITEVSAPFFNEVVPLEGNSEFTIAAQEFTRPFSLAPGESMRLAFRARTEASVNPENLNPANIGIFLSAGDPFDLSSARPPLVINIDSLDAHRNEPTFAHQNGPGQCAEVCAAL